MFNWRAIVCSQKLVDTKGCDSIAELSVTVRKFKRTAVLRERQQRNAMLENVGFHERLLSGVVCPPMDLQGMNAEHFQNLALDILLWVTAIQINHSAKRYCSCWKTKTKTQKHKKTHTHMHITVATMGCRVLHIF
jgi:hypothetical protein